MKKILPIIIIVLIIAGIFALGKLTSKEVPSPLVTSFEECANAGYPVMESYPRQCAHNGQTFVENIFPVATGGCYVGGCSTQICSDEKDVASDCQYKEEYACYQSATCERQSSGKCGWTETTGFLQCMSAVSSSNDIRIAGGYIAGHIDIGPNCPVEQAGKPCPTPPEAYSSREVIVYESNGTTVRERGKIDSKGNFNIAVGPGDYFVQVSPAGIGPGEKKPAKVISFKTTIINFDIDTGIR